MFTNFSRYDDSVLLLEVPTAWNSYESQVVVHDNNKELVGQFTPRNIGASSVIRQGLGMVGTRSDSAKFQRAPPIKTNNVIPVKEAGTTGVTGTTKIKSPDPVLENIPLSSIENSQVKEAGNDFRNGTKFDKRFSFYTIDEDDLYKDRTSNQHQNNEVQQPYRRSINNYSTTSNLDHESFLMPSGSSNQGNNREVFIRKVNAVAATLEKATAKELHSSCWKSFLKFLNQLTLPNSEEDIKEVEEKGKLLYWHKSEVENVGSVYNTPMMGTEYVIVHYKELRKDLDEKYPFELNEERKSNLNPPSDP